MPAEVQQEHTVGIYTGQGARQSPAQLATAPGILRIKKRVDAGRNFRGSGQHVVFDPNGQQLRQTLADGRLLGKQAHKKLAPNAVNVGIQTCNSIRRVGLSGEETHFAEKASTTVNANNTGFLSFAALLTNLDLAVANKIEKCRWISLTIDVFGLIVMQ